jgi:hypothetical protein
MGPGLHLARRAIAHETGGAVLLTLQGRVSFFAVTDFVICESPGLAPAHIATALN